MYFYLDNPHEDKHECGVCGKQMQEDKPYCSFDCFEADMR
jgi:predicted nucleic acid-binding Zn ribbon protein